MSKTVSSANIPPIVAFLHHANSSLLAGSQEADSSCFLLLHVGFPNIWRARKMMEFNWIPGGMRDRNSLRLIVVKEQTGYCV